MGAQAGRAAEKVLPKPLLELARRRRLSLVAQLALAQAKLGRDLGKGRREELHDLTPGGDKHRSELRDALCPRLERLLRRLTCREPPQPAFRCASAAAYSSEPQHDWKQAAERAIEVGTAHAGPPLTTASRSGVKTSTGSRDRSSSAARSGAPLSRARFASPTLSVTSTAIGEPPWSPSTAIRAPSSPKRISCASDRVRGEKPWAATCRLSSRFVLPAPFGPTASTIPGSRSSSSDAYER